MRVLGIDPGTWKTGVGILETKGNHYHLVCAELIKVKEGVPLPQRLLKIYRGILEQIQIHKPEVLALENIFFGKDVTAMVKVGEARACAMLAAAECGIDVVEYPPARVKQAVSGNGRATKEQIQHMVKTLLSLKILPQEDTADALAVAICHVHSSQGQRLSQKVNQVSPAVKLREALKTL